MKFIKTTPSRGNGVFSLMALFALVRGGLFLSALLLFTLSLPSCAGGPKASVSIN